uniref:BPTI/Kunitz inhibitor domain-containing protein n=1 Tax=Echeneis naucrates TaxID=173247 RepID=A0A665U227_ECHNA
RCRAEDRSVSLDADSGLQCADYVQAWYYDKHIGACSPFWYGGCAGNANRFNTENECFQTCGAQSDCFLRQDAGGCQNYTMMWYFDTEQNECSRFWYGGCGGNENRFKTQEECENLCLTRSRISQFIISQSAALFLDESIKWICLDGVQPHCRLFQRRFRRKRFEASFPL